MFFVEAIALGFFMYCVYIVFFENAQLISGCMLSPLDGLGNFRVGGLLFHAWDGGRLQSAYGLLPSPPSQAPWPK